MSGYDGPGDGWREADDMPPGGRVLAYYGGVDGVPARYWVPEEQVPPLPTEDMTILFAHWGEDSSTEIIKTPLGWRFVELVDMSDDDIARITGFEVLAEPIRWGEQRMKDEAERVRRETAKAVLDRVNDRIGQGGRAGFVDDLRREFGVGS